MPESNVHQILVVRLVHEVLRAMGRDSKVCRVDGIQSLGNAPPTLNGHRPDVFAFNRDIRVIGEAKPPSDLESERSLRQLKAFAEYVDSEPSCHLVLAVYWETSFTARNILRRLATQSSGLEARLHVSDGVDPLSPLQGLGGHVDDA